MAGTDRVPPDDLKALGQLEAEPFRFSLFAALRLLEQAFHERPRLGESRKASDDAVRLGQTPHLSFAPSDVCAFERPNDGPARLEQYSFGVLGPNGALPLHFTEHAYERRRHKEDGTVVDFLNVFQHRLISLFYRAWADADPATNLDRPDGDRFATYVGALLGIAPEAARGADGLSVYAKLGHAPHFLAQTRSAESLEAILADYFELPVEIRQHVGAWLVIPKDLYCRLGAEGLAELGRAATLGTATWQCQHKFEIVLGPLSLGSFTQFLPGSRALAELHALVRFYTNGEWTWQLRLLLRDVEVPGATLGRMGQLGWSTWLAPSRVTADDVLIQEPRARGASSTVLDSLRPS
ncbi:MAG TPA: type VI secretion system baseplate subunit TssG [Steroidobacteraceae bacterium]|nr:type VI secretion system baseplate subunit TssG [Steroidobacteraceae bacterium]